MSPTDEIGADGPDGHAREALRRTPGPEGRPGAVSPRKGQGADRNGRAYRTVAALPRRRRLRPARPRGRADRGAQSRTGRHPDRDCRRTRMPLSLVSADKNLVPLPAGHFLRDKVEDPAGLKALAESEPSETLRLLLASFGRAMTVQEVRDNLGGLVDDVEVGELLGSRAQEQAGSASRAPARAPWSPGRASADAAEESVRAAFEAAGPAEEDRSRAQEREAVEGPRALLRRGSGGGGATGGPAAAGSRLGALAGGRQARAGRSPRRSRRRSCWPSRTRLRSSPRSSDQAARQSALEAIRAGRADWAGRLSRADPEGGRRARARRALRRAWATARRT